jgi:hypothetical protein
MHAFKGLKAPLPCLFGWRCYNLYWMAKQHLLLKVAMVSVWTNGSTCMKELILINLAAVVSAVRANIDQCLPSGQKLHTLAGLAWEASASFVMCLVSYIKENHESYALSKYPGAMQWSLNLCLGYRVC